MPWSHAFTVQPGNGKEHCQDAVAIQTDGDSIVLAIADGAGSALQGGAAAQLAVTSSLELHEKLWEGAWQELVEEIQCRLRQAASDGEKVQDYACTLVLASVKPEGVRFLQVGDGGGVLRTDNLSWIGAEPGEYMNVTTFLHEPVALEKAVFVEQDTMPDAICLFSDGLQHLIVDPLTGALHTPFFERVLAAPSAEGQDQRASDWLANMANSEPVRKRTNDDIGIAVARRLTP